MDYKVIDAIWMKRKLFCSIRKYYGVNIRTCFFSREKIVFCFGLTAFGVILPCAYKDNIIRNDEWLTDVDRHIGVKIFPQEKSGYFFFDDIKALYAPEVGRVDSPILCGSLI